MYYNNMTSEEYEKHFFAYPHMHGMKPFRIFGNCYYAGDDNVGIHLFDTGEGLIILDTGYPQMQGLTIQSIWELGFKPGDIKIILHTHGHYDHIGSTNLLKELSGAKTYISAADAEMMEKRPELTYAPAQEFIFTPDVRLSDGDEIRLGSVKIRVRSAPGHTMGTLAIFATVTDGEKELIAGMHGGVGLNTVSREYIEKYALPDMQSLYRESLEKLKGEHVDIVLGNHTKQNDTPGKYQRLIDDPAAPNPFIDSGEWSKFLARYERNFDEMREREREMK